VAVGIGAAKPFTGETEGLTGITGGEDIAVGNISIWVISQFLYVLGYRDIRPVLCQHLTAPRFNVAEQNRAA
tara:strand:- start:197 stop:412 length:216 start_codon:yes stop_codon:yes gene_type:complete